MTDPYLTVAEAAKALRLHEATVRRYVHAGKLPGKVVGSAVRVHRSALEPDEVDEGLWTPAGTTKPRPGPRGEFSARLRSIGRRGEG